MNLDEFRKQYAADDNVWWTLGSGDMQNLFDDACDRIDWLEAELRRVVPRSGMVQDMDAQEKAWRVFESSSGSSELQRLRAALDYIDGHGCDDDSHIAEDALAGRWPYTCECGHAWTDHDQYGCQIYGDRNPPCDCTLIDPVTKFDRVQHKAVPRHADASEDASQPPVIPEFVRDRVDVIDETVEGERTDSFPDLSDAEVEELTQAFTDRMRGLRNDYRIALRPDERGADPMGSDTLLDDIVVREVPMFRAEDLGDGWWVCCYLNDPPGTERICWHVRAVRKGVIEWTTTEFPENVTYEHDEGDDNDD